ncbi:hypothetical protein JD844_002057 [Phrynosoma platyrhinos]|uniref:Acid-sensing ion channel 2 n=1 Tax=Phrynosoma platyrhinos TaxID=52577 RepID=A0ABQ7TAR4_PHRPL|nr:hypothetical protein JD844_002057 [Phrynosoma platyrhinos]
MLCPNSKVNCKAQKYKPEVEFGAENELLQPIVEDKLAPHSATAAWPYMVLGEKDSGYCVCQMPCNLTRYNKELSMVKIPSKTSAKYLEKKFNKSEKYISAQLGSMQYLELFVQMAQMWMVVQTRKSLSSTAAKKDRQVFGQSQTEVKNTDRQSYDAVQRSGKNKNILVLDIFFEALNYETIEQKKAYEVAALLGDIGGQMGLFIGASILTILEIFDYIYELLKEKLLDLLGQEEEEGSHDENVSTCEPLPNHSDPISHTVTVPLQTTLGTLEEIAC